MQIGSGAYGIEFLPEEGQNFSRANLIVGWSVDPGNHFCPYNKSKLDCAFLTVQFDPNSSVVGKWIDMKGENLEHMRENIEDVKYAEKWARKTLASV